MDYKRIEFLLDKYWQCRTTLEEEDELRCCFSNEGRLPEHLQPFRELFVLQTQERQMCLTDDFDRKILSEIRKGKVRRRVFRKPLFQAAAVIVLLAFAGGTLVWQQSRGKANKQAQEQALVEVQQALAFVSLKLNRGQQILEKNIEEVKMVTQFIK